MIAAESLTDDELVELDGLMPVYTLEVYNAILLVLDMRESVSRTRTRLKYFFQAAGLDLITQGAPKIGSSQIFVGSALS